MADNDTDDQTEGGNESSQPRGIILPEGELIEPNTTAEAPGPAPAEASTDIVVRQEEAPAKLPVPAEPDPAELYRQEERYRSERGLPPQMFDLPNVGLRFLIDARQSQESASLLLQWCLDQDAIEYFARQKIDDPLIIITVTNAMGKEERYLLRVFDWQQRIPFHRAGLHKIHARVIWGAEKSKLRKEYLAWWDRGSYTASLGAIKERRQGLGNAEHEIDVHDGFFSPPLSANKQWWYEYWLGEMWDSCNVTRRAWFAWTIQLLLVGIWKFFSTIARILSAFVLTVILLQRKVRWRAIVHPFEYSLEEVWRVADWPPRSKQDALVGSLILYGADGKLRPKIANIAWALFPPFHIVLLSISAALKYFMQGESYIGVTGAVYFFVLYWGGVAVLCIGAIAAFVILFAALVSKVGEQIGEKFPEQPPELRAPKVKGPGPWKRLRTYLRGKLFDGWEYLFAARRERRRLERQRLAQEARIAADAALRARLHSISCEAAPETGIRPVSAISSIWTAPRLYLQVAKSNPKVCRPVQRG